MEATFPFPTNSHGAHADDEMTETESEADFDAQKPENGNDVLDNNDSNAVVESGRDARPAENQQQPIGNEVVPNERVMNLFSGDSNLDDVPLDAELNKVAFRVADSDDTPPLGAAKKEQADDNGESPDTFDKTYERKKGSEESKSEGEARSERRELDTSVESRAKSTGTGGKDCSKDPNGSPDADGGTEAVHASVYDCSKSTKGAKSAPKGGDKNNSFEESGEVIQGNKESQTSIDDLKCHEEIDWTVRLNESNLQSSTLPEFPTENETASESVPFDNDVGSAVETVQASRPSDRNESNQDREEHVVDGTSFRPPSTLQKNADGLYLCPPGKRPTGMKWNAHRGLFVTKSSPSPARDSDENHDELAKDPSPSILKKDVNGPHRCPRGGRRPIGMKWDSRRGKFVPKSAFRKASSSACDSDESGDDFVDNSDKIRSRKKRSRKRGRRELRENGKGDKRARRNHSISSSNLPNSAASTKARGSADLGKSPQKPREPGTEVGSRVYGLWKGNKRWYWGVIVDIKRKKNSHFDQYSILFDDGDFEEYASRSTFSTAFQYREKPPPLPKAHAAKLKKILKSKGADNSSSSPVPRRSPLTLAQLLEHGCGDCTNCTKDDCGRCATCLSTNRREVCIQKMCCKIPIDCKAQPMPPASNFPEGWKYIIDPEIEGYHLEKAPMECLEGLKLLPSSGHFEFYSVEGAKRARRKTLKNVSADNFYEYLGAFPVSESDDGESIEPRNQANRTNQSVSEIRITTDNFLIGRYYCFAWTNLKGQQKVIYGRITECKISSHTDEAIAYNVVYSDQSRALANAVKNGCGSFVPESQWLEPPMAIGGCVRYQEQSSGVVAARHSSNNRNLPFSWRWSNPDARHEEHVEGLPRLTVAVRGYELIFEVKRSRIPNAGNGVFLRCKQLIDNDNEQVPFELKAGESVDVGIYAPLRIEDRKPEAAVYVKNFIHHSKCEVFAFDRKGSTDQLDITDDITGELHTQARKHIHAYVNESNDNNRICIWAEHDAEGSVHYLLGHALELQGKFTLPCGGKEEREVFINYGPQYEKARIRKGYSFLPDDQEGILEELRDEDMKDVLEMSRFSSGEVEKASNFLFGLFAEEQTSRFTDSGMVERSLLCAAVLQRRATYLYLDEGIDASGCQENLKTVRKVLRKLVSILLGMVKDDQDELTQLQTIGNVNKLLKTILERQYSEEELSKLGDLLE